MKIAVVGRVTNRFLEAMKEYVRDLPQDATVLVPRVSGGSTCRVVEVAQSRGLDCSLMELTTEQDGHRLLESSARFLLAAEVARVADLVVVFDEPEGESNESLFELKRNFLKDLVTFQVRHGKRVEWRG